jgi:uncharacterized protein
MNLEQIEKLNELKEKGLITEEEFQHAKERTLASEPVTTPLVGDPKPIEIKTNNYDYALVMHLSQFASWMIPVLGILAPLVLWLSRREDPYIDQQGKVIMNWILSSLIYAGICWVLCLILIGFLLFGALAILSLVFIIMGAMNANKGIIKNYPLAIRFFAVDETPRV